MAETLESVQGIIRRATGSKKKDVDIPITAPLQDIVMSSLQFVVILGEIERIFEVTVPDEYLDPTKFRDVASIVDLVQRLRGVAA